MRTSRDQTQDQVSIEVISARPYVHLILPLSGRVHRFESFLKQLIDIIRISRKHGRSAVECGRAYVCVCVYVGTCLRLVYVAACGLLRWVFSLSGVERHKRLT